MDTPANSGTVRLAEVIGCLALATDLAIGLPLEHGLRRTLIALWLGEELGLDADELSSVYYVALLGSVACVLNEAAFADCVRDDIEFRSRMFTDVDISRALPSFAYFARMVGEGQPPWRRFQQLLYIATRSHAVSLDIALQCGDMLDIGPSVREALGQCDEHWDGKLAVLGLKGDEISLSAALFLLAQDVDVYHRVGGVERALEIVRDRAGRFYSPQLAERFCDVAQPLLTRLDMAPAWQAVMDAEPSPHHTLSPEELRDVLHKVANFIDVRSAYTIGHSPAVAALSEGAARELGLPEVDATNLHYAGLLHDLGRAGVPVTVWNSKKQLRPADWQRIHDHAAMTELVLARSPALGPLGTISALHHERLDGSGYRGVSAASLPITARVLAAADAFQTKVEPRPHRGALHKDAAADHVRREATNGKLDPDAVEAVLRAAGQARTARKQELPCGLSERELEVLRLAVRGLTNKEIAEMLVLSPKTVGHHIESIYRKTGVSTRVGAAIFAVNNGLIDAQLPLVP